VDHRLLSTNASNSWLLKNETDNKAGIHDREDLLR
jgi:hypothetical protein